MWLTQENGYVQLQNYLKDASNTASKPKQSPLLRKTMDSRKENSNNGGRKIRRWKLKKMLYSLKHTTILSIEMCSPTARASVSALLSTFHWSQQKLNMGGNKSQSCRWLQHQDKVSLYLQNHWPGSSKVIKPVQSNWKAIPKRYFLNTTGHF